MTKRILIVDDEPNIRLSFRYGLLSDAWQIEEAVSGTDAVAKVKQTPFDLILLDLRMPGLDGIEVLQRLSDLKIRVPVVMVSAHATTDTVLQAIRRGTLDFLTKPVTPQQLRESIQEVLGRFDLARSYLDLEGKMDLSPQEQLQLAKYYVYEGEYQSASVLFMQLAGGENYREEALVMLGIINELSGNFTQAESHYNKLLNPVSPRKEKAAETTRSNWLFEQLSGGT